MAVSFDEVFDPEKRPDWLIKWEKKFDEWLTSTFCTGIEGEVKYKDIDVELLNSNQLLALAELYRETGWVVRFSKSPGGYYWFVYFKPYRAPKPCRRWWSLWLVKR
jgi:hypothetical protein